MRIKDAKTAMNWGIYWDTAVNTLSFIGTGTERASIDLDTGDAQFDGDVTADVDVTPLGVPLMFECEGNVGNCIVFAFGGQICDD